MAGAVAVPALAVGLGRSYVDAGAVAGRAASGRGVVIGPSELLIARRSRLAHHRAVITQMRATESTAILTTLPDLLRRAGHQKPLLAAVSATESASRCASLVISSLPEICGNSSFRAAWWTGFLALPLPQINLA